ncbi:hypothetical protein COE90_28725, partial [Bacillus pseudomycoides]|uniref:hypothetical protein n=1 Tax=Bacillus pseudomycoides TaxID=64104 RepID=UPI000C026FB2
MKKATFLLRKVAAYCCKTNPSSEVANRFSQLLFATKIVYKSILIFQHISHCYEEQNLTATCFLPFLKLAHDRKRAFMSFFNLYLYRRRMTTL